MRDIIKRAGFSQGAIYRYYSNLDEIYIDLINKSTADNFLEQKIDALLSSEQAEKTILSECIMAIGEYIEELLKSVGGKTCFELMIFYAYDNAKRNTVFPRLKFKHSLESAQNKLVNYTINNIQRGILHPTISMNAIIMFICVSIDGIAQTVSMSEIGDNDQDKRLTLDISEMFETLAKAIINFLEE